MPSAKNMMTKLIVTLVGIMFMSTASASDIALTVYNSDLGVVREVRNLTFEEGNGRVAFTDVAAKIDATSVSFKMADTTLAVAILEQNYAYDLVSPDKIYQKYIDKTIDIVTEQGELFSGTLLSFGGGYLVIQSTDGRIKSIATGQVRDVTFPELPEGLITRPTLFWLYTSEYEGAADAIVSYQTSGIKWQAEYVGILGSDEKSMDLTGWVSIDNRSGKTYRDAKLKVIAGDIARVDDRRRGPQLAETDFMTMTPKAAGFEEKAFFEYHMYTLPRKATIADNEIKQVTMFETAHASVKKELRYNAEPHMKNVLVYLKTRNAEDDGLGMPLPKGRVRIFQADTDDAMILLGEDMIDHTARNEEIKLRIGEAFDVVGETTIVNRRKISDKVDETDYRVEVRNQKRDDSVTVVVHKSLGGFWEITTSSVDFIKKSANEVEWTLDIAADDKRVIDFTVRQTRR